MIVRFIHYLNVLDITFRAMNNYDADRLGYTHELTFPTDLEVVNASCIAIDLGFEYRHEPKTITKAYITVNDECELAYLLLSVM